MSIQVFGTPVSRGVAIGRAVLVASSRVDVAHYFVAAEQAEQFEHPGAHGAAGHAQPCGVYEHAGLHPPRAGFS